MALWGKSDSIYSIGTIDSIDYSNKVIVGSGTSFTAAEVGDVITIGVGATYGEAIITGITSNTQISIASTAFLIGQIPSGGGAGVAYTMSEKPIYTLHDTNYTATEIYGVDINETGVAKTTKYAVAHAGWVGVHTYIDMHGTLRVKSETLVAMSEITSGTSATYAAGGDANDDTRYPDAIISILSGPQSVGVGTTATATFSVSASITPTYAPLTYQWYEDDGVSPVTIGTNSANVSVANTDASKDGYEYYVVLTSGDVSVTSGIATMTVS
jgi:hypothetical protein